MDIRNPDGGEHPSVTPSPTKAPAPTGATRAYSYVRFSTPSQAAGASLERQTERAAKYALDHGLTLDTELNMTDLGVSAFRGKNARTGALGEFLEAVQKGYVERGSYLLIENMDRLSRADIITAQGLFSLLISSGITVVIDREDLMKLTWSKASDIWKNGEATWSADFDPESWKEKKVTEVVALMQRTNVAAGLLQDPEVTAMVLQRLGSRLPEALIELWAGDYPELIEELAAQMADPTPDVDF